MVSFIPLFILGIVFLLIAVRQIGKVRLQIWQIMLGGAVAALFTRQITPLAALQSINIDVIVFLVGMFVVGEALVQSGYLSHRAYTFFRQATSSDMLILFILFGAAMASAFLMNDTLAIIGTPLVLLLAKKHALPVKLVLLALAFAVTIGSVVSPIGNPQNLLIALTGNLENPFVTFFRYLFIPTIINLLIAYLLLRYFYKAYFQTLPFNPSQEPIKDHRLASLSKTSVGLLVSLVFIKIALVFLNIDVDIKLPVIALLSALPILLFAPKRVEIIKNIDWHTLLFFASMFVLMQAVWNSGVFQAIIASLNLNVTSLIFIFMVSVVLSQFISNVPLVALYLPLLLEAGASAKELLALAAGSTIAGNLFILGAASNVIIIQNAEEKYHETITFWEFARIGIPLTIANVVVYWVFLV